MRNYLSILIVLLMLGCGNRSQPSVITANTKLMEQMDSIIGDIYERDTIGKHGKIDPVGTDEIDPVKTA